MLKYAKKFGEQMNEILSHPYFSLYGIPLLICLARMMDVSLGTLRIIFVSKGFKVLAMVLGFFEVTIWIMAIGEVMKNLDNFVNILAYATGYSLGTYIGVMLENRLAIGIVVLRIITKRDSTELVEYLREKNYSLSVVEAEGNLGAVSVIFINIKRSRVKDLVPIIYKINPLATYSIEDIRHVSDPLTVGDTQSRWDLRGFLPRLKK